MKETVTLIALAAALAGCATDVFDPSAPELNRGAVAQAKADGAFGAETIALGDSVEAEVSGSAFSLYALEIERGDRIRLTAQRAAGDARPAAYLYRGTETFLPPDAFETEGDAITLDYSIEEGGEHHIVLKAYRGEGAGRLSLETACSGGSCAGEPADPLAARSRCIEEAARCALADLPRWDGRVGETRAGNILTSCLEARGGECADACDGDGAALCDTIVEELPTLADRDETCHDVLQGCLDECAAIGGLYGPSTRLEQTAAAACWSGVFGNCIEFVRAHAACGGTDYDTGTPEECRARCAAAEGAWTEGPFDGCEEACEEL